MLDFFEWLLGMGDPHTEKGKEIIKLLQSVITTYVPLYMGNQMLFWSGQFWEKSFPVFSRRVKSLDLVNSDLKKGVGELDVLIPL